MDLNAMLQNANTPPIAVAWKVAGALVLWLAGRWLIGLGVADARQGARPAAVRRDATRYVQTGLSGSSSTSCSSSRFSASSGSRRRVRGAHRGRWRRHRHRLGRPARELRGRRVPGPPAAVQGGRFRHRRRRHGHASRTSGSSARPSTRPTTSSRSSATTRSSPTPSRILGERLPARRPDGADRPRRRSSPGDRAAQRESSSGIPNVLATPAPDVDVLQFTPAGPVLCVRPYCTTSTTGRCTSTRTG